MATDEAAGEDAGEAAGEAAGGDARFALLAPDLARLVAQARDRPLLDAIGGLDALLRAIRVDVRVGLDAHDSDALAARLDWFGRNYVAPPTPKTLLQLMYAAAFQDSTNAMLIAAGVASVVVGASAQSGEHGSSWIEGACVLAAVAAIVLVTATTEHTKEQQFQTLNAVKNNPMVHVLRSAAPCEIPQWDLLVGDVVVLHTGDVVPADGVLLEARQLRVDESAMTGEAEPVSKNTAAKNIVLGGTTVMEGSATMVVVSVGEHTQEGQLLQLVHGKKQVADREKAKASAAAGNNANATAVEDVYMRIESPTPGVPRPDAANVDQQGDEEAEALQKTPLARKLDRLNLTMGKVGAVLAVVVFTVQALRLSITTFVQDDEPWRAEFAGEYVSFFILAITILVVAIPEGLPLAVVIALTYSVRQMLKENNLVRHLYACEIAGNATIICSDKTGTLTKNEMTVTDVWVAGIEFASAREVACGVDRVTLDHLVDTMAINSSAELLASESPEDEGNDQARRTRSTGSPTESALLRFVRDAGHDYRQRRADAKITGVIPFSSDRKRMSTVVRRSSTMTRVYTKGAPELVLARCSYMHSSGTAGVCADPVLASKPLDAQQREELLTSVVRKYASRGCRTLCVAYRDIEVEMSADAISLGTAPGADRLESALTLLAIVAIEDPIRAEVPHAIAMCQSAGVAVCMVTGDNMLTAVSIARQCGILPHGGSDDEGNRAGALVAMDAAEFRAHVTDAASGALEQDAFDRVWPTLRVLARATPMDKHVLVSGLVATQTTPLGRQLVAVTGDGTNDAPALKKAHVGFAMGRGGTEVAKRASDVVVLDDNFLSIVHAIKWGRNVYDSIAKFLQFQLTVIFVAVTLAVVGALFLERPPLTAVQILWVNLFMDAFVSLALATETPTATVMARAPYRVDAPLLSRVMWKHVLGQCVYQLAVLLTLAFVGETLFASPSLDDKDAGHVTKDPNAPSVHLTVVFNTFAWLQLVNEVNARRVYDERNVFEGLAANRAFVAGWCMQALLQAAAVQFGGSLFHTQPLSGVQWLVCIGLASVALPLRYALSLVAIPGATTAATAMPTASATAPADETR